MIKSMNIGWWVQRWSELNPEKTAILFEEEKISYSQLDARANEVCCWLQSVGIEKGDRVAVMLDNRPEFIELYLACARLGSIFVPINFRLTGRELEYILENSRPRLFLFADSFAPIVKTIELENFLPPMIVATVGVHSNTMGVFEYLPETARFQGQKPFITQSIGPSNPEEPHVIMYTSGTTGQPKGAVLSHRKTFFNCLNAETFFKLDFEDIMLIILPLFHSGGLFIQASPTLYKGATMIIHPRFDPARTYRDIEYYRVTKLLGVPTIYRALLEVENEKRQDIKGLKISAIGGEKTTPEFLLQCKNAGFPLRQIMGQTETSILLWASEKDLLLKPGTVGKPVFHAEVAVVDKNSRQVSPGEIGEIVVRGSIMMQEYWRDPIKTEQTIRNGWLHTEDLASIDEDGYFFLAARATEMYISGGENVYTAEVEQILQEHSHIKEAAVTGVQDKEWGEVGHAFLILKKDVELDTGEIYSFLQGKIAHFKYPKKFTFCEDFPRTFLGKVRKGALIGSE